MTRSWRLNLLLPGGVKVQGEATRLANGVSVDLRQPFASLSESREISASDSPEDEAQVEEVAGQILKRLYRLAEQLQNKRPELELGLAHARARLARFPGLVSDDQFRGTRRDLRRQLRSGLLTNLEYQRRLMRLRKAYQKSRWAFAASLWRSDAGGARWASALASELSRHTSVPLSDVAASLAAVRVVWDEFFRKAFPFELTDLTRGQVVAILDRWNPLVNQLPAAGCCKCGRTIESVGGLRLLPKALEIERPKDEAGRRRWICQRCAHSDCRACGWLYSFPMGHDILDDDGHISHAMIVGASPCNNPACHH